MAPPVYSVGQVLGAADCNNWFLPLAAYKTSVQNVSNTTLTNDTALFVTVAANAVYRAELVLLYDGDTAADIKLAWTTPSGATLSTAFAAGLTTAAAAATDDETVGSSSTPAFGNLNTGLGAALHYIYILTTSSTSGTLQLQWAQNASSATATHVSAGSHLLLWRVG